MRPPFAHGDDRVWYGISQFIETMMQRRATVWTRIKAIFACIAVVFSLTIAPTLEVVKHGLSGDHIVFDLQHDHALPDAHPDQIEHDHLGPAILNANCDYTQARPKQNRRPICFVADSLRHAGIRRPPRLILT